MTYDEDGMQRVDIEWSIQGRDPRKDRSGKLYGLHEQERANAIAMIKRHARRGDTVLVNVL